jgi:hypothetical protein
MSAHLHLEQAGFATDHPPGEAVISGSVDSPFDSSTAPVQLVADAQPIRCSTPANMTRERGQKTFDTMTTVEP